MAEVVAFDGKVTPEISSKLLTMPTVKMRLVYDDAPVSALRKLGNQWALFERHFREKFQPRLKVRLDLLHRQMISDVRDWEMAAASMPEDKRTAFVATMNKELQDWLERWLRIVEKDCTQSCDEAFKQTMTELKGQINNARFKAVAKAVTVTAIKIAAGMKVPPVGLLQIVKAVYDRGQSIKGTYDELKADWADLEAISEAVAKDIPPAQIAMQAYLRAKAGGGVADKLKAFWLAVEAPAKKLDSDVNKMDQAIALTRQSLLSQSNAIRLMKDQLNKAGKDVHAAKTYAALTKEEQGRARLAQELKNAERIKAEAQKALAAMKEMRMPDFTELTRVVNGVKNGAAVEKDLGKDVADLLGAVGEWVKNTH